MPLKFAGAVYIYTKMQQAKAYRQIGGSQLQGSMVVLSMPLKLPGGTGTTQNQRGSTQETNREHARNTPETQRPRNRGEAHAKQTGGTQGTAGGLPHKKKSIAKSAIVDLKAALYLSMPLKFAGAVYIYTKMQQAEAYRQIGDSRL